MAAAIPPERSRSPTLFYFLTVSILVHLLLLSWLARQELQSAGGVPAPVVVKLAPFEEQLPELAAGQQDKQIVAPSDRENDLAPLGPSYLSDRNNRVEKETVRKGNPEAGIPDAPPRGAQTLTPSAPPSRAQPPAAPQPPAPPARKEAPAEPAPRRAPREPAPPEAKKLPGLRELFAPPAQVLAQARTQGARSAKAQKASPRSDPRRDLVSAPPPARGVFSGLRGTFDDLPDVAPGQLTMLNTKADRFAPFVRRVGTRVFQNLLIYQRNELQTAEILAANRPVTIRAFLDPEGRLKELRVVERSGSHAVDQTLVKALREAAFDHNPPKAAANEDGDFEFLFKARLRAQLAGSGRRQRIRRLESALALGLL